MELCYNSTQSDGLPGRGFIGSYGKDTWIFRIRRLILTENYHTHTYRCRHADGTEREYIEKALSLGLTTLGFSEHAPYRFPGGYVSWYHLQPEDTEDYVQTLLALREEYRGRIALPLGFEAEYYPALFGELTRRLRDLPVDYLILGQHSLNNETDGVSCYDETESPTLLAAYVDQCLAGLDTGLFSILAHPDLFHFTGSEAVYTREMTRLCRYARENGIALEVNLLGLSNGRHYPSQRFFRIARDCGCTVIAGLDAHRVENILQPDTLPAYRAFVEELGLAIQPSIPLRKPF